MSSIGKMNHEGFAREFVEAYLKNGFANMPKREIDLLVLHLLITHSDAWSWEHPPSAFELSQKLRTKRGRLRSMLDELSFRNAADEEKVRARLHRLLEESEKDIDGNKVKVQIEDGYLREYAKSLVQADFGIVDTSFDRSIVTLSGDKFLMLVSEVMGDKEKQAFEKELNKHRKDLPAAKEKDGLLKTFLEEFVKSAGKEAGKKAIKLGASALTGGLSEIPDLIESFFKQTNGSEATA